MERYTLVITRWVDKTPEDIELELKNRNYNDRFRIDDERYMNDMQKQKTEQVLTTSLSKEQFEAVRKTAVEVF
jgi:hypothetical protein